MEKKAKYFERSDDDKVKCLLCPVGCKLKEGKSGVCRGRFCKDGELIVSNYGKVVSLSIDPIEKKPLYHFYPGQPILSTGPNGCNLKCANCQNWNISQENSQTRYISPEKMTEVCLNDGSIGVAYTYTEPFIWFEYLYDTMPLVQKNGGKNVLVTNGYVMPEPLEGILPFIDAMNIDLKSIDDKFYRKICHGRLENVQHTITRAYEFGIHIEITNLLITDLNDSSKQISDLINWVASISPSIPLHFSRYYPTYKMKNPGTSEETLKQAYEIARKKMDYVYLGNINVQGTSDTFCPKCGIELINRQGYYANIKNLSGTTCGVCGYEVNLII
ncbi:MAG: AmmeMemoRadiSam system radical SAM enzyme [candidate division Zixibacteria bacterium]|nr:AmmeMemoRadiSam system radical SAM enzyme [candidate division Zixibacteria bacterium]